MIFDWDVKQDIFEVNLKFTTHFEIFQRISNGQKGSI